jgi:two-component system sensor histidine kinase UhpB
VFAANATVLTVATLALVLSPATVSFPIALTEVVVLACGLSAMLLVEYAVLRQTFGPLQRLTAVMRDIDPLRPGTRTPTAGLDPEVAELAGTFNDMLARLERERRDSARRALSAQEDERRRIARELHDEVGQVLTAVVLQLDRGKIEEAREAVLSSLEDVREIARRLRPEALDDLGLASALTALTNEVRRSGLEVERSIDPRVPALSDEEELVIYRVAQEALTNALRHASAGAARVTLAERDGHVELAIRDDGQGFDVATQPEGAGLRGMRERAVLIGARLDVESVRGEGTTVRVLIEPGA